MAREIVMPRLGNTVESVVIVDWHKQVGERAAAGEPLCEVETDKATVEVEAEEAGVLLVRLFEAGDEVPVLAPFAVIGEAGEDVSGWGGGRLDSTGAPLGGAAEADGGALGAGERLDSTGAPLGGEGAPEVDRDAPGGLGAAAAEGGLGGQSPGVSPRARRLAAESGLVGAASEGEGGLRADSGGSRVNLPVSGSGPGGRIIERDVQALLESRPPLTPAAQAAAAGGDGADRAALSIPGTGIGGRITTEDLYSASQGGVSANPAAPSQITPNPKTQGGVQPNPAAPAAPTPLTPIRKLIAARMHASLAETAQLTLNSSADASALLQLRGQFKAAPEQSGLSQITIGHIIMFTLAKVLPGYPELNAAFSPAGITRFSSVHLGFAVDSPRGLMVPVIPHAETLSLARLSAEARRLADACLQGTVNPDELSGGTFTVTNLGAFGIETFTPILNTPQVAILGVGTIINAPVETADGGIGLQKRIGLSLTIDHQALDGAPAARFLKDLSDMLAHPSWSLAR